MVANERPRKPIDLIPIYVGDRPITPIGSLAHQLHKLREKIHRQIVFSDGNNKSAADLQERMQDFFVGDEVMIKVHPKRFPT